MRIVDTGYLIAKKPFGEGKQLLSFFTNSFGRVNGMARITRKNPIDLGYLCAINWTAKLEHQLGFVTYDVITPLNAVWVHDYMALCALQSIAALLSKLLVDHHPYPLLYTSVEHLYKALNESLLCGKASWYFAYIQFEKTLLEQLGFGLDLTTCAVTGGVENLAYISPKSGHAVSQSVGRPYHDRLLPFPYLLNNSGSNEAHAMESALNVLGYFLKKHFFDKGLPASRQGLIDAVMPHDRRSVLTAR